MFPIALPCAFLRGPLLLLVLLFVPQAVAQLGPDSLRFAVIADPQYADKPVRGSQDSPEGACYRGTLAKMDSAIAFFNRLAPHTPAFLLLLGDYIDSYGQDPEDSAKSLADLDSMNARVSKFQGDVYLVLGNHDALSLHKEDVYARLVAKVKQNHYSFDAGPVHFVVLDGNFSADGTGFGRLAPGKWNDAWIPESQLDWLVADLQAAGERPTIVAIHQNLHGDSVDGYTIRNAAAVRKILETHGNVTHVLQGHRHLGGYARINGIHYVTFPAMLNCPASASDTGVANGNNYSLVTIRDTVLFVDGRGRSPDLVLPHAGLEKTGWVSGSGAQGVYGETIRMLRDPLEVVATSLVVRAAGSYSIRVLDVSGRFVYARDGEGPATYALSELGVAAGTGTLYVIVLRTAQETFTRKVVRF